MHIGAQIEVHMAVYIAVDIKVHVEVHVEVHSAYNSAKLIHQHVRKRWNAFLKFGRAFSVIYFGFFGTLKILAKNPLNFFHGFLDQILARFQLNINFKGVVARCSRPP